MRIRHIIAEGFKRFVNLTVSGLPETARLVVLVGPNGCGKSSLIEAMNYHFRRKGYGMESEPTYHKNNQNRLVVNIMFHGGDPGASDVHKLFYARSAYRHVAQFNVSGFSRIDEGSHAVRRLPRLTGIDTEVETNYHRLQRQVMSSIYARKGKTDTEIVDEHTSSIADALSRILPDLKLRSLEEPEGQSGTFHFAKGKMEKYSYENLSGGERAAFDLLLDMAIKRDMFPNAVHCIDEPETHIGMGAQGKLLEVMFGFIPKESQLWIATHSIGMLRKASELSVAHPGEVVFLDFCNQNFDEPVTIKPAEPNRAFWRKMHDVALEDMAELVAPDTIVICESNKEFDAQCYNRIFSVTHPNVQFASVGGKGILKAVRDALIRAEIRTNILTLRDRDNMSPEKVKKYQADGGRVLRRTCIEEYLSDDEVLEAFCQKFECPQSVPILKEIRDKASHPKAPFEDIRKKMLGLSNGTPIGDDRDDFMVNTLAPLITPETKVYRQLKEDIFGEE